MSACARSRLTSFVVLTIAPPGPRGPAKPIAKRGRRLLSEVGRVGVQQLMGVPVGRGRSVQRLDMRQLVEGAEVVLRRRGLRRQGEVVADPVVAFLGVAIRG